ncbi:DNA-binding protein, partial [Kitasatospora sp. NPDC059571]|uniref:DNA-binding protein n=1 Tax=Kitasatospora sp. NPDC059571 TaxID=3346871 RepID=UPI0036A50D2A
MTYDDAELTGRQADELLRAGAVLPPGTRGASERAVPLTARTYRHPALDDRVVVRLVAAELGAAEDLAAGYLGLEPAAGPAEVGLGLRQALGFPEWVLAHHPEDGHHALGLMPELERVARQTATKPKAALEAYQEIAGRLAAAVPHFLPTFYEQAGRVFLGAENATYAAQLFSRARRAEAEHGLPLDEERLDAVFLEFALAGALPVKVLSSYAKELSARVPADEAFARFRTLCVRRTAGGLPPSAQMATDLRRMARAAGADPETAEGAYLADLLALPATLRAGSGWWKRHQDALTALARREPATRGRLLDLMPTADDGDLPAVWLEVLIASGAADGLCEDAGPDAPRPADGTAGWFERFLAWRGSGWRRRDPIPALYPLVERAAARLRAELADGGAVRVTEGDVDLLDQLLALGVPVADPGENTTLALELWAHQEERRDLLALAADPRFRAAFDRGTDRIGNHHDGLIALSVLARSPGARPMLAAWTARVAAHSRAAGLPDLPGALHRISWLPGEVLALAEDEVREAIGNDVSAVLARTLRDGLLDELGWPAWEEAVASLVPRKDVDDIVVADAWPHLVVAGPSQARVIGGEGTLLTHDLRIPAGDSNSDPGFHHVDDSLLVLWPSRANNNRITGYWHTAADRVFTTPEGTRARGTRMTWLGAMRTHSLPLPGGGRTTGDGVVHVGDTAFPTDRRVIGDGTSFWVLHRADSDQPSRWHEYDPATGAVGRASLPGFLGDALHGAPAGSTLRSGWVLPAGAAEPGPCAAPVGGVLGWRTVDLPDGSVRGEDAAGRSVTLPHGAGVPGRLVVFPGADRPQAVVPDNYRVRLVGQDGTTLATARTDDAPGSFAEGTLILPPMRYWHFLQPRDPQGSAALRRIDDAAAAALVKAACALTGEQREELTAAVRALLPEVTDAALAAGVAGVVRFAAEQQRNLDAAAKRLADRLAGVGEPAEPTGPADGVLHRGLNGLGTLTSWYGSDRNRYVSGQLEFLAAACAPDREPAAPGTLHVDGADLPYERMPWTALGEIAVPAALRAASPLGTAEEREALAHLVRGLDAVGLASAGGVAHWRRARLHLAARHLAAADGSVRYGQRNALVALGGGAFLLFADTDTAANGDTESTVLHHDPEGLFAVPAPYTVLSSEPLRGPSDDRAARLLATAAERGPAPWFPEAAEEFARLTGVSTTMAALVVAGLPRIDSWERSFLPAEDRRLIGVKVTDAAVAKDELRGLDAGFRRRRAAARVAAPP